MNEPERLHLGEDRVGDLLRDYQANQRAVLERSATGPAFEAMEQERRLRAKHRLWLNSGALAVAAVSVLALGYLRSMSSGSEDSALGLRAEPPAISRQGGDAPRGSEPAAEHDPTEDQVDSLGTHQLEVGSPRDSGDNAAVAARPERQEARSGLPKSGSCPSAGTATVAERRACLAREANESGLSGEVALLELSRIDRNALGRPTDALAWVEQSLARFPGGALRNEAELAKLELLIQLGRSREALELVRGLVQSGRHDSRRTELLRLEAQLSSSAAK